METIPDKMIDDKIYIMLIIKAEIRNGIAIINKLENEALAKKYLIP